MKILTGGDAKFNEVGPIGGGGWSEYSYNLISSDFNGGKTSPSICFRLQRAKEDGR